MKKLKEHPEIPKTGSIQELESLMKKYKTDPKMVSFVTEILQQGDVRYTDPWEAISVAGFVESGAIQVTKNEVKISALPTEKDLLAITGPQKEHKYFASIIAKHQGYKDLEYESSVGSLRADVFARKEDEELYIECCSCSFNKPVTFLSIQKVILWVIQREIIDGNLIYYELKRGENWDKFNKFQNEYISTEIDRHYKKLEQNWL